MSGIDRLISRHKLISDQVSTREIKLILTQLDTVIDKGITGDIVEFGCYFGTTSLFIQRWLQSRSSPKSFHVYDSFAGLPEKTDADHSPAGDQFEAGKLLASKSDFVRSFKQANLPLPTIHKSWFNQLSSHDLPPEIALAFLDGDYYESIWASLKLIETKLSPGAIIIVDDYQSEALPGAAKAVDQWLNSRPHLKLHIEQSLAIIYG